MTDPGGEPRSDSIGEPEEESPTFDPAPFDGPEDLEAAEAEAENRRIRAWADSGATPLPALIVTLASAAVGAVTVFFRRRRRQ